ncbi:MAG TPA: hypothetical protein VGA18_00180 [Rhodothermales bacterium]
MIDPCVGPGTQQRRHMYQVNHLIKVVALAALGVAMMIIVVFQI